MERGELAGLGVRLWKGRIVPDLQDDDLREWISRKASVEGVYDALRGGHRNLRADKDTAVALERAFPDTGERMLEERAFTARAVAWAAGRGIRQFVVAGAGIPAPAGLNAHDAARSVRPDAVTVYASADPYAVAWTQGLLAEGDPLIASVQASVSVPAQVYGDPGLTGLIDFADPVCVVAPMVLHFAPPPLARRMLRGLATPLAPGSAVAVSAWSSCEPEQAAEFDRLFAIQPIWRHSEASIARWMTASGCGSSPGPATVIRASSTRGCGPPGVGGRQAARPACWAHRRRGRGPGVRPGARNRHGRAAIARPETAPRREAVSQRETPTPPFGFQVMPGLPSRDVRGRRLRNSRGLSSTGFAA